MIPINTAGVGALSVLEELCPPALEVRCSPTMTFSLSQAWPCAVPVAPAVTELPEMAAKAAVAVPGSMAALVVLVVVVVVVTELTAPAVMAVSGVVVAVPLVVVH